MSFLADLGERLRTDIADIARASADPVFAQQLSEARFRREDREQIREADMRKLQLRFAQEDAQRKLQAKSAVQIKLVEDAIDQGRNTGDFSTLYRLTQSPGMLDETAGYAKQAYQARFGRSWQSLVKEQELQNATRRLSAQDTANLLRSQELNSREEIAMQKMAFDNTKFQYERAQEILKQNRDVTNRESLVQSIRGEKGVWTEPEKEAIVTSMNSADSQTALKIYQQAWDNYWKKKDLLFKQSQETNKRNRNNMAALVPPSTVEVDQAYNFIEQQLGERLTTDELEPTQFQAFAIELATTAKRMARDKRKQFGLETDFGLELPNAFNDVRRGFEGEEGFFDYADFSLKRLEEQRAQDAAVVSTSVAGQTDDVLIRQAIREQGLQPGDKFEHTFQDGVTRRITVTEQLTQ